MDNVEIQVNPETEKWHYRPTPKIQYRDPNTGQLLPVFIPRPETIRLLELYSFSDDGGNIIDWSDGQLEIIDCILYRSSPDLRKRVEIIASTQYGKSLAVGAGVALRASLKPEKWAIVAGTNEKARIIMEYVIMFSLNSSIIRTQLTADTPLDRLKMKKSSQWITYKKGGSVKVYSADSTKVNQTSTSLMGFGSPNVIEDESGLIGDTLQSTVMRMLGGSKDNFLIKIGNPFNRNHFLRTWESGKYYRIFIDYVRALEEGRYTKDYIEEMRQEAMFGILYACLFPKEDPDDKSGWMQLLTPLTIERATANAMQIFGQFKLGNDVAGGGRNYSVSVLRGYNVAKKLYKKNEPDTMIFAGNVVGFMHQLRIRPQDVFTDCVGVGKGASDRIHETDNRTVAVNVGLPPTDKKRFFNLRAEAYWRLKEWIEHGGKLEADEDWLQLTQIKYRVNAKGQIQIMPKETMLKLYGIDSPDVADGLSLTFVTKDELFYDNDEKDVINDGSNSLPNSDDPYEQ